MKRAIRTACISMALLVAVVSCSGKVKEFSALPNHVCRGDSVLVKWKTKGETTLIGFRNPSTTQDTEERIPKSFFRIPVDEDGIATFWFNESVGLEIHAERGGRPAYGRADVVVSPSEPWADSFAVIISPGVTDSMAGRQTLDSGWKENIRIGGIWSVDADRPFLIRFQGRQALLTPDGTPSSAFDGLRASGTWEIRCALLPSENSAGQPAPAIDRLHFGLKLACEREN